MIRLTRLNGKEFVVNAELIKYVEETPDTLVTLATGEKLMVREKLDEVVERARQYRIRIFRDPPGRPESDPSERG